MNVIRVLANAGFEKFSIYGFSIDYPSVCSIDLNRKSKRASGDVVFHFPDKEKVILIWGNLEKAQKRFHTVDEHAEHGIKRISTSGPVKSCERVNKDSIEVNSHRAAYNCIKVNQSVSVFAKDKTVTRDGYSLHLHCQNSSRYFIISTLLSSKAPQHFGELMKTMMDSFKCH